LSTESLASRTFPFCVKPTREFHEKLTTGVQGHQAAPGRFRKIQNWIGKPGSTIATASYIPRPPGEVRADANRAGAERGKQPVWLSAVMRDYIQPAVRKPGINKKMS
jgi:hypothetical protein